MPQQVPVQPTLVVDEHMHANPCVVTTNLSLNVTLTLVWGPVISDVREASEQFEDDLSRGTDL